jgi:hypothetical protein
MKTNSTLKVFLIGLVAIVLPSLAYSVNVKFTVDMTGIDQTGGTGVYLLGQLNSWTHSPMTLEPGSTTVYSVTLNLTAGAQHIYYYTINTLWAPNQLRETVPTACALSSTVPSGWTGDRAITVPAADVTIAEIYSGCSTTAISGLVVDELNAYSKDGQILVNVASPSEVSIYSLDGKVVSKQMVEKSAYISCTKGVYAVKANNKVVKVLVTK